MKLFWIALVGVCVMAPVARADEATARVTYKQAEDLRKAGKWADACPLYAASYKDDPQLGVLLHLAECHEKIGKIATAWSEFSDAAELGHDRHDARESAARAAADVLAPRLPKLHITPPPAAVPGLVVLRDDVDVTVLVGQDIPVDPGEHVIVARAPGYVDAKLGTIAAEGKTAQLALPALQPEAAAKQPVAPPASHEARLEVTTQPDAHIALDTKELGVGHFAGTVASGGHQLRVTAPGMVPYQSEILISEGVPRTIEVTLERAQPASAVVAAQPEAPVERFGGVRLFAGTSIDGLSSQASNCSGGTGIYCGTGPRGDLGLFAGARVRIHITSRVSFDPGIALHVRHVYLEHCSPCMQTAALGFEDVELSAMLRYGMVDSKFQLSLLGGLFGAARFGESNDFAAQTGQPAPTMGPGKGDLGLSFALEAFYQRFGAQIMVLYGTQAVSDVVNAPMLSIGWSLGFRI